MVRLFFDNGESGARAAAAYAAAYPNMRHPDAKVIDAAVRRLRESGNVMPVNVGGRPRTVRVPAMEDEVLRRVQENPRTSTRCIGEEMGVSHVLVHKVLKAERMHPYHFTRVQKLLPRDYAPRLSFSRKLLNRIVVEPNFLRRVLWTDECTFTQDEFFNFHNYHHYGEENPFLTWDGDSQFRFKLNVWAAMIDDQLVSQSRFSDHTPLIGYCP